MGGGWRRQGKPPEWPAGLTSVGQGRKEGGSIESLTLQHSSKRPQLGPKTSARKDHPWGVLSLARVGLPEAGSCAWPWRIQEAVVGPSINYAPHSTSCDTFSWLSCCPHPTSSNLSYFQPAHNCWEADVHTEYICSRLMMRRKNIEDKKYTEKFKAGWRFLELLRKRRYNELWVFSAIVC